VKIRPVTFNGGDMKKILLACLIVLMSSSFALADWVDIFKTNYQERGIDQAVIDAMKEGATPALILDEGLRLEGLNPIKLVQALYCAGAKGPEVEQASRAAGLSELAISTGYEKSVAECGDVVADTQAYTPVASTPTFISTDEGGNVVFSPASF